MDLAWAAKDVIHLEVGEPNFPTPPHIVAAAARAASSGQTKYVANAGVAQLRQAIAGKLRIRNGWDVAPDDVVVTAGGVQALYLSLLAVLEPVEGVLIPARGCPNFRRIPPAPNGRFQPYPLRAQEQYQPGVEDLAAVATPATRAIILNSPSNPLGSVVSASRVAEILEWSYERGLWVISDECYDEIVFGEDFVSTGALGSWPNVISCYSFSKTYAMTGWRVGYAVSTNEDARTCLAKLQEPIISCVNVPAQMAALAALEGPQEAVGRMRDAYRARRDAAVRELASGGVRVRVPAGGFYLWVDVSPWGTDDWSLASSLLDQAGVAVAPGTSFGANGAGVVRISLATEMPMLLEGIGRLLAYLARRDRSAAK